MDMDGVMMGAEAASWFESKFTLTIAGKRIGASAARSLILAMVATIVVLVVVVVVATSDQPDEQTSSPFAAGATVAPPPPPVLPSPSGFNCAVGQHVFAIWAGDGNFWPATIATIGNTVTVNWADGDSSHREMSIAEVKDDSGVPCLANQSPPPPPAASARCMDDPSCDALISNLGCAHDRKLTPTSLSLNVLEPKCSHEPPFPA
jgi:hypothetical protein